MSWFQLNVDDKRMIDTNDNKVFMHPLPYLMPKWTIGVIGEAKTYNENSLENDDIHDVIEYCQYYSIHVDHWTKYCSVIQQIRTMVGKEDESCALLLSSHMIVPINNSEMDVFMDISFDGIIVYIPIDIATCFHYFYTIVNHIDRDGKIDLIVVSAIMTMENVVPLHALASIFGYRALISITYEYMMYRLPYRIKRVNEQLQESMNRGNQLESDLYRMQQEKDDIYRENVHLHQQLDQAHRRFRVGIVVVSYLFLGGWMSFSDHA
jgi:hypothetical protein